MKNILVTGGSGFLGKRVIENLRRKGYEVVSYDIAHGMDILNTEQLESIIVNSRISTIIHLAAVSDLNIFRDNVSLSNMINIQGTRNVLSLCNSYGIRLLFASTCCCYGNNEIHPSDEASPISPTEPYAKSKAVSEQDILAYGLPHTCMRLATFYGPNMRESLAPAVFLDRAHRNKDIKIHGNGLQTRTFTYIDDIVSGIITILENKPRYTIINITSTEEVSVLTVASIAKRLTKNDVRISYVEDRQGQIYKEQISNNRLMNLGWKPKINFEKGMALSYEQYQQNGSIWN
ncbi:hypothetical protein K7432_016180 [Basidiobolus ranarum]|uniref:NAD-dependent epimerase/dehydratase domain-containing protein n=1 Tax=Basidiobolus ranarum TaxID=34480 RepID=A0ABR2WF54_9FUNG